MLKRDTARPAVWSEDWTDGLVDIKETLDWLRLFYDVYEASDFWTQAEIDADDYDGPSVVEAGDLKPNVSDADVSEMAAAGRPYNYDARVDAVFAAAIDQVEYHSGISLFSTNWTWDVDVQKGALYSYNRWIKLECPVTPVGSISEIRVLDTSCDVENRDDHMELVDEDDYFVQENDIYISKRWTYRSPGKFDLYRVEYGTTAYTDLSSLNSAILKLTAYLYEHAGDEMGSKDPIVESGALASLSRHFEGPETIFAL